MHPQITDLIRSAASSPFAAGPLLAGPAHCRVLLPPHRSAVPHPILRLAHASKHLCPHIVQPGICRVDPREAACPCCVPDGVHGDGCALRRRAARRAGAGACLIHTLQRVNKNGVGKACARIKERILFLRRWASSCCCRSSCRFRPPSSTAQCVRGYQTGHRTVSPEGDASG